MGLKKLPVIKSSVGGRHLAVPFSEKKKKRKKWPASRRYINGAELCRMKELNGWSFAPITE